MIRSLITLTLSVILFNACIAHQTNNTCSNLARSNFNALHESKIQGKWFQLFRSNNIEFENGDCGVFDISQTANGLEWYLNDIVNGRNNTLAGISLRYKVGNMTYNQYDNTLLKSNSNDEMNFGV